MKSVTRFITDSFSDFSSRLSRFSSYLDLDSLTRDQLFDLIMNLSSPDIEWSGLLDSGQKSGLERVLNTRPTQFDYPISTDSRKYFKDSLSQIFLCTWKDVATVCDDFIILNSALDLGLITNNLAFYHCDSDGGLMVSISTSSVEQRKNSPCFLGDRKKLMALYEGIASERYHVVPPDLQSEIMSLIYAGELATVRYSDLSQDPRIRYDENKIESKRTDYAIHSYYSNRSEPNIRTSFYTKLFNKVSDPLAFSVNLAVIPENELRPHLMQHGMIARACSLKKSESSSSTPLLHAAYRDINSGNNSIFGMARNPYAVRENIGPF